MDKNEYSAYVKYAKKKKDGELSPSFSIVTGLPVVDGQRKRGAALTVEWTIEHILDAVPGQAVMLNLAIGLAVEQVAMIVYDGEIVVHIITPK